MKLIEKFHILSLRGFRSKEPAIYLELNPDYLHYADLSVVHLNKRLCSRFGIPMHLSIIGGALVCTFDLVLPDVYQNILEDAGTQLVENGDSDFGVFLDIAGLERTERTDEVCEAVTPGDSPILTKKTFVDRVMTLSLPGMFENQLQTLSPAFSFKMNLSEELYRNAVAIPAGSRFCLTDITYKSPKHNLYA